MFPKPTRKYVQQRPLKAVKWNKCEIYVFSPLFIGFHLGRFDGVDFTGDKNTPKIVVCRISFRLTRRRVTISRKKFFHLEARFSVYVSNTPESDGATFTPRRRDLV